MTGEGQQQSEACGCYAAPVKHLVSDQELGMDSRFAEISVLVCRDCGQQWLKYFYEVEGFTASARWYLGAITPEQSARLTAENAKSILEGLDWYCYGGSYYREQSGRTSGEIGLNP